MLRLPQMDELSLALLEGAVKAGVTSVWRWGCKECGAHDEGFKNRRAARAALDKHLKKCPGKPVEPPATEVPEEPPVLPPDKPASCFGQYDPDVPECEVCVLNQECASELALSRSPDGEEPPDER